MAINLGPPDPHDARARIEVVPAAVLLEPAVCAGTVRAVVAPLPILLFPTGDHDAISVEAVRCIANDNVLRGREAAVLELPLPAGTGVHPVCGGCRRRGIRGRGRLGIRGGLRSGRWIDRRRGSRSRVHRRGGSRARIHRRSRSGLRVYRRRRGRSRRNILARVVQAQVRGINAHEINVLVPAGLIQQAPGSITQRMQGRVGHVSTFEDLALVPGEAIIVGHANRSIRAGTRRIRIREEQHACARRTLRRIRVCTNDRSIVARISQVPIVTERTPGLTAIVGNRLEALARGALRPRVEQQAPVRELNDLVLIRTTFTGSARLPRCAVVVGVDRNRHERGATRICDRILLN